MAMPTLESIEINDQDIDDIEKLLGNVVFDRHRRDIIKDLSSFDVQAFPGSGKTTVLIAKLAILAKKWPFTHKGICVLSHTNVAREEIEYRLGQTELGKKLLSYPHFIGTLHSFCDTYVAIPWLRSNGYHISMIDTEITIEQRWRKLPYGTRAYLEGKRKTEQVCEAVSFPVSVEVGCSKTTDTYRNVQRIVEESQQQGYFTFNEMLQIAKHVANSCSEICNATQRRFPILLIDEAQDTSAAQWELISSVFCDNGLSIRQSYGDANQAIFQSYGETETARFPSSTRTLTIANSHRFDNTIAKLVDCFAVSQRGMTGDATRYSKIQNQHTIFLFDKENISAVLQAYADHILTCFSDEELADAVRQGCYAVSMVHKKEPEPQDSAHFPVGLRDYYTAYDPCVSKSNPKPIYLIDYFRMGPYASTSTHDHYHSIEAICKAFRRIIQSNTGIKLSSTSKAFDSLINQLSFDLQVGFRKQLCELSYMPITTKEEWNAVIEKSKKILMDYFGTSSLSPFLLQWKSKDQSIQSETGNRTATQTNIYTYTDQLSGRSIDIHLASIHSVKGQTHLATLAMESYWHGPNIKGILSCLYGKSIRQPGVRDLMRMKCHYVALTRASGLVCVALPISSVKDEEIVLLQEHGWNVVKL